MKKLSLALGFAAASLLSLSSNAMAQVYVSGNVGVGHVNVECQGFASCDNTNAAFKLTGGYSFNNKWSAELGYIDFGKSKISAPGLSGDLKVSGFTVGAAYLHPVAQNVDLSLRGGLAVLKTKASGDLLVTGSETNTHPYIGFGAVYSINKHLKAEAGVDISNAKYQGESGTVTAFTVGARYAF